MAKKKCFLKRYAWVIVLIVFLIFAFYVYYKFGYTSQTIFPAGEGPVSPTKGVAIP